MRSEINRAWALVVALAVALLASTAGYGQAGGEHEDDNRVLMDILDDDAVLIVREEDGRELVRVIGRNRIVHRQRVAWSDELDYDSGRGTAVMTGNVEVIDEGEDNLTLHADHVELNLDDETATATGNVRFVQGDTHGRSDRLHYGEYARVKAAIDAELSRRNEAALQSVREALAEFASGDRVLLLVGRVELEDGERSFNTELAVINTRSDAVLSLGRSSARLPGPQD
ncbi:MAG: hypothetical protein H0Z37_08285 [Firmicutes bacterium]|nr:hypothetical protein [Bacillota bacterium]